MDMAALFDMAKLFSRVVVCQFTLPSAGHAWSSFSTSSPTLGIICVLRFSHSEGGCNLHFPNDQLNWARPVYSLTIWIYLGR